MRDVTVNIGTLVLHDGSRLESVEQRVTMYGDPAGPVVLVPHALTGHSRVTEWWGALAGPGKLFDPQHFAIVGINALGSCYGSSGPATRAQFPYVTVRDIVAAQARALDALRISHLHAVIGASLGGMQALQWALDFPSRVRQAVMVGSHDHQSAMGIALNAVQREAIALHPSAGLRIARKIAMLSYKSDGLLRARHDRRADRKGRFRFDVEGYLAYQADLFEARMEPASYAALTEAMDSFDVRGVEPLDTSPHLLFVGISSDWLFLPADVRAAAQRFAGLGFHSRYREIVSGHGHDAFLAEPQLLDSILREELLELGTGTS